MTEYVVSRALSHFFRAYFHEDWDLEADDWQGLVDGYVRDEEPNPAMLRSLADEIDDVNEPPVEADMRRFVTHTLGAKYYPLPELTYEEWLKEIGTRLRQHADGIDAAASRPIS